MTPLIRVLLAIVGLLLVLQGARTWLNPTAEADSWRDYLKPVAKLLRREPESAPYRDFVPPPRLASFMVAAGGLTLIVFAAFGR
jgi:hypothetical protein